VRHFFRIGNGLNLIAFVILICILPCKQFVCGRGLDKMFPRVSFIKGSLCAAQERSRFSKMNLYILGCIFCPDSRHNYCGVGEGLKVATVSTKKTEAISLTWDLCGPLIYWRSQLGIEVLWLSSSAVELWNWDPSFKYIKTLLFTSIRGRKTNSLILLQENCGSYRRRKSLNNNYSYL